MISSSKKLIYLDNAATTKIDERVLKEMIPYLSKNFGNPSSLYKLGKESRIAIENSRKKISDFLKCKQDEIIFTSGATESNNLAIKGLALAHPEKKHIITSQIEHSSVLLVCKEMERLGYKVDYISVDKSGILNLQELKNKITKDTLLVSIMHVNNEIGTIQPIEEIGKVCHQNNILFHVDATQSFGKIKIDLTNINLLSASAHKLNGPKGTGLIYIKDLTKIRPMLNGGSQERKLRAGTENVAGIVGFGKAIELAKEKMKNNEKVKKLRDFMIDEILKIKGSYLNGSREKRIFNNANFRFDGVEGEAILIMLDQENIAVSTGSACSSSSLKPSYVLTSMGLKPEETHSSLRVSLGYENTKKEIDFAIKKIKFSVEKIRKISGEFKC